MLLFAVSYKLQYVEIVRRGRKSLQSICKDLDVATSHQHSIQRAAVHHIQPVRKNKSRRIRADLESASVMGEQVWVIDLTLDTKKGKAAVWLE